MYRRQGNTVAVGSVFFWLILLAVVPLSFVPTAQASDQTITGVHTFASLDGSAQDDDGTANGVFTVNGNLTIATGGSITCDDPASPPNNSACNITIVVGGNMLMEAGSAITAENNVSGGSGGNINITVGGDMTLCGTQGNGICIHPATPGAVISASKNATGGGGVGGNITITVGNFKATPPTGDFRMETGTKVLANSGKVAGAININVAHGIDVDGLVSSGEEVPANSNTTQGGPISLIAGCTLNISDTGVVSSRGDDPGADLVHLQAGCTVTIFGLVESTGPAHEPGIANLCKAPNRPDKPANSTACVEVWAGDSLLIDSTGAHNGEINADIGFSGGTQGISWIDLFARGNITINGPSSAPYAVHANMGLGNGHGGLIKVYSRDGKVTTSGLAIQANDTSNGGHGGSVDVEAGGSGTPNGDVNFGTASIQAKGAPGGGGTQGGGTILAQANGQILGSSGGELNAGGGPPAGSVTLLACGGVTYTGTVTGTKTTGVPAVCPFKPTFASYVKLPDCPCGETPNPKCPICTLDTNGQPVPVVVDQNVTVNFNTNPPTCSGDADLCNPTVFSFTKVGTPDQWQAIFNVGANKFLLKSGATITTTLVPTGGSSFAAPGIVIKTTCEVEIEKGGTVVVQSSNGKAGDILIQSDGPVVINGTVKDVVVGTLGLPGNITVATCCGDITTGTDSLILTEGVDPGGSDINLLACCTDGDINLNGLVLARARAHVTGNPLPDIRVFSATGSITINSLKQPGNLNEPFFDEFTINGTLFDIFRGLLSLVTGSNVPGSVTVQAFKDVTVIGHGNDATGTVRTSFAAITAGSLTSNSAGGTVDVRALTGTLSGSDRAFEVFGRYNANALIRLFAAGNISLTRPGATAAFNPVVDAASTGGNPGSGGTNDIRSFSGGIGIGANALVTATGATPGVNDLTSCLGVTIGAGGAVTPADLNPGDDSGVCAPPQPDPIFANCQDPRFKPNPGVTFP